MRADRLLFKLELLDNFSNFVLQKCLTTTIDSTGNSTGAHLHLALYYHGSPSENDLNYAEMT